MVYRFHTRSRKRHPLNVDNIMIEHQKACACQSFGKQTSISNFSEQISFRRNKKCMPTWLCMSRRSALTTTGGPFLGIQVAQTTSVDTSNSAVPRDSHPPASSPADLARLTCEQDLRSFNASRGWLGAPTHYSGQRDVGTGMLHHHNAVKALFQVAARGMVPYFMRHFGV